MADFHFELGHLADSSDLLLDVNGVSLAELENHDASSQELFAERHPTLRHLPASARSKLTHFVELDERRLGTGGICWIRVVRRRQDGVHLPELVLAGLHVPEPYLRAFYAHRFELAQWPVEDLRCFHRHGLRSPHRLHSATLADLGMESLPEDREAAMEVLVHAQRLVTVLDTAATVVSYHPDLASVQPFTATVVRHDHVLPDPEVDPDQYNAMQAVKRAIQDPGHQPWSPVIPCRDKDGKEIRAGYSLDGIQKGQVVHTYGLSAPVMDTLPTATAGARRTAADDLRLESHTWAPTSGTSVLTRVKPTSAARRAALHLGKADDDGPSYKWTVAERTEHHGVTVDQETIKIDAKDRVTIDTYNSYLRTLSAGYELFDESGRSLGRPVYLDWVGATNSILGIPVPTAPTTLGFELKDATSIKLYFGSMGVTDWNLQFSSSGLLLTSIFQYGIPTVLLVAGTAFKSTKTFNRIWNDKDLRAAALAVGFAVVGGGSATASALINTEFVLSALADAVAGMIVDSALEKLGEWLAEKVAEGAISSAFGPVGIALRVAAAGINLENMAITTAQALASPACLTIGVSRALDVKLRLLPDPRHGEAGKPGTAVWPAVASTYVAMLQYRGGTSRRLEGEMDDTTGGAPVDLLFEDVPAGGELRIRAGFYSPSGWLCGAWQSDWLAAKPNQGTTLDLGEEHIEEKLVPLAPDAQYVFKERMEFRGGKFVWDASGDPPTTPRTALDRDGNPLRALLGITINNSAFQVGFGWLASGQKLHPDDPTVPPSDKPLYAVQNLSVLADPSSRLKTTRIGFSERPAIAYAPSTNTKNEVDPSNFVLDPRQGGMHLRRVVLGQGDDFGFGAAGLKSWGRFPLENVDALAVHPSRLVVAASWKNHKLMVLPLPEAGVDDDKAPEALLVSGEGMREGLLQGPAALAVAPDGRILVLETINRRVQAFDVKGNAVPSFTPFPTYFRAKTAAVAPDFDRGVLPEIFREGLRSSGAIVPIEIDRSLVARLDSGRFEAYEDSHEDPRFQGLVDPLIAALSQRGIILAYDPASMDDPEVSAQIEIVKKGEAWILTDPRHRAWDVRFSGGRLLVFERPVDVEVRVEKAGARWLVTDRASATSWRIEPSDAEAGTSRVRACRSYFPLQGMRGKTVTYLDMAVESQGYVYILSFVGDGSRAQDYLLDVYGPDGSHTLRTPDPSVTDKPQNVVAGRIAVDVWRNLFGLTYETLEGPRGAPQAGLAHWIPTPPLFTLDVALQKDFNDRNIGTVAQAFAAKGVELSSEAFVRVVDPEGAWEVKDGEAAYHIYRSGDGLQVYRVPA